MLAAFWLSFSVIFVAELGDKSQLMALAFASRVRALPVLAAITLSTSVVHVLSVGLGAAAGSALPTDAVGVAAGLAFLGFGVWTLRGEDLDDDETAAATRARSVILSIATVFFLTEMGDKTMFATITLAADNEPVGTWAGSTAGMVAADALALVVGRAIGERLPARIIRIGSAAAFFVFGAVTLAGAVL